MSKSKQLLSRAIAAVKRPFVSAPVEPEPEVVPPVEAIVEEAPVLSVARRPASVTVVLEGIGPVDVPARDWRAFMIQVNKQTYTHVGEDAQGRWVYRAN